MINDDVRKLLEHHQLPTNKVDDMLSAHFEGKKKLFDILGLNEKNDWRINVPLPEVSESKESVAMFLREIEECCGDYKALDKNSEYMMKDKAKVRVGKIFGYYLQNYYFEALRLVSRYYKDVKKQKLEHCDGFLKENLVYTYALLKEAKITFEDGDIWDEKKIENIVSKFSCFYGDYIKSKRVGYISGNPLDYLLLSGAGTTFSSCIRIGGEYFNSCLHYLHNPNTFISYTTDDNYQTVNRDIDRQLKDIPKDIRNAVHKKIGRSLFYLNDGLIIASRYYGSYYEPENLAFIDYLKEKMGGGFKQTTTQVQGNFFTNNNTGAYIDFGHTKAFIQEKWKKINFDSGNCLRCGMQIGEHPTKGICRPCYEGRAMCDVCGKKYGKVHSTKYNIYICEDCMKSYIHCDCCGDYVKRDDITQVLRYNGEVRKYCDRCVKERCKKCSCGKVFRPENSKETLCYVCKKAKEKVEAEKAIESLAKIDRFEEEEEE